MKVLCLSYEYPPIGGGGGVVCQGLAEALTQRGYEIDVVTTGMADLPANEVIGGVRIHRVPCIRRHKHYTTTPEMLSQVFMAFRKALELSKQNRYDFNHTHFIVPSGLSSYLLWKKTGLPYIITLHGSDVPGYNPDRFSLAHSLIRTPWRAIVNNSQALTSPSNFLVNLFQRNSERQITVIPNGFDSAAKSIQAKKKRIIVVSRMFERKGVQFFLRAIAQLNVDWEVLIAGDGPYLPQLRAEAEQITPWVRFLGYIQGQQLTDLYQSAQIFVFPSLQENFPVVLLEAMSAGCAVITTNTSGCAEVVGDAAITTPPADVKALRHALMRLLGDQKMVQQYAERSLERAAEFSWPKIGRKFDLFFRSLHHS